MASIFLSLHTCHPGTKNQLSFFLIIQIAMTSISFPFRQLSPMASLSKDPWWVPLWLLFTHCPQPGEWEHTGPPEAAPHCWRKNDMQGKAGRCYACLNWVLFLFLGVVGLKKVGIAVLDCEYVLHFFVCAFPSGMDSVSWWDLLLQTSAQDMHLTLLTDFISHLLPFPTGNILFI